MIQCLVLKHLWRYKMYVKVPELNISDDQCQALIKCFDDNIHNKTTYVAQNGIDTTLTILTELDNTNEIVNYLINRISKKYYFSFVFLGNKGNITPHKDDDRQAVITFPLITNDTPTSFLQEDNHDTVINELYYNTNEAVMWNTKIWHKVLPTDQFRLFFQIELKRDNSYEFYYNELMSGNLII